MIRSVSDPDEFLFGDDFNNNTIPDYLEDDLKDDTPYDLDRRGYHFNFNYSPLQNLSFYVGSMKTHSVGRDSRTNNNYFKTKYNYNVLDVGSFYLEYRYERIKDNIADAYLVGDESSVTGASDSYGRPARYTSLLHFDEIEYRNSSVNRIYADAKIRPVSAITIENHVRYEHNAQVEGEMYDSVYQPDNTINTLALVNKVAYTKQLGNFVFSPGIKFRLYKKQYETFENPRDHYLMTIPLVTFKYNVSPRTAITLGFQGFAGLETTYTDYVLDRNSYKQKNTLFVIENVSSYFGFDIQGSAGFQYEQVAFDETVRKFEEYKSSSLFIRVWLGY